jgi:hypothetical protein
MRIISLLAVVLTLAPVVCGAEPQPERQYLIKLKICEGKTDAKADDPSAKVLSMPQLLTLEAKTCRVQSGGEILLPEFGTKAQEHAETGINAVINCRRIDDESVRLDMKLNYANVTVNQPETFVLSDVGARVLLKAKLNTPVKTVLQEAGKNKLAKWIEVEVEEVPIPVVK